MWVIFIFIVSCNNSIILNNVSIIKKKRRSFASGDANADMKNQTDLKTEEPAFWFDTNK